MPESFIALTCSAERVKVRFVPPYAADASRPELPTVFLGVRCSRLSDAEL